MNPVRVQYRCTIFTRTLLFFPSIGKWKMVETWMNNLQLQTWESGWLRPIPNKREKEMQKWKRSIVRGEFSRNFSLLHREKSWNSHWSWTSVSFRRARIFKNIFNEIFFFFFYLFPPTIGCFAMVNYSHRLKCHFKCRRLFASMTANNKYYVSRKKRLDCMKGFIEVGWMEASVRDTEIIFSSSCKYYIFVERKFDEVRRDERFIKY